MRRFVACRDDGDADGAARWWRVLVEDNFDRVRGMVELSGRRLGLSADECQDAVQGALVRLWTQMRESFEGTSVGEWVNATRTCATFACLDVQREAAERHRREPSLDATVTNDEGEQAGRFDWRQNELAHEAHRRNAEIAEAREWVADALPRIGNERYRRAVEDMLNGVCAEESAAALGVTVDHLYQLRTRGLKVLRGLEEPEA